MNNKKNISLFCLVVISITTLMGIPISAYAGQHGFGANSYIFASDYCWQPNGDNQQATLPAGTANKVCDTYGGTTSTDDQSLFQLYGLLYALLDTGNKLDSSGQPSLCKNVDGTDPLQKTLLKFSTCKQIKINWIIKPDKTSNQDVDLEISSTDATVVGSKGLVTIYNSKYLNKAGTTTDKVYYRGGPFVIEANDLSATDFAKIKAAFPAVKMHQSNVPFTGNIDKVLVGKPPKVAVLDEGKYFTILLDYIRAAGQFPWSGTVFQQVTPKDVLNGCLEDPIPAACKTGNPAITIPFQLIWAPHWEIDTTYPVNTKNTATNTANLENQKKIVGKIRKFLEDGNSGFFECASIASLESGKRLSDGSTVGMNVDSLTGGFLIDNTVAKPRLDTNGGCNSDNVNCNSSYVAAEKPAFWLTQCGGWKYKPTSGLVENMRPNMESKYSYLTSSLKDDSLTTDNDQFVGTQMTRFLHDDKAKLNGAYTIGTSPEDYYTYDYLVGGRINGTATQGYVVYFPGHKYISCTGASSTSVPPARTLEFTFDTPPISSIPISIEIVHEKCTSGVNCPKIFFDRSSGKGGRDSDAYLDISSEFATFNADTNKLEGVVFTSTFDDKALAQLVIKDIVVTYDDTTGTSKLDSIVDLTDISKRLVLCSPKIASSGVPISCYGGISTNQLTLNFSGDITTDPVNKFVKVSATSSTGTATVSFDLTPLADNTGAITSVNGITLDLRQATFDVATKKLINVIIHPSASCNEVKLTDFTVSFPGSGVKLAQVYNQTTGATACAPNSVSPAICSSVTSSSNIETMLTTLIFDKNYIVNNVNNTNIVMEFTYTCSPNCSGGVVKNTYNTSSTPNSGQITSDANGTNTGTVLQIDTSAAFFSDVKTLKDIKLIKLDNTKIVKLTDLKFTFAAKSADGQDTQRTKTFVDNVSNTNIFSSTKSSVATYTLSTAKEIKGTKTTVSNQWEYTLSPGTCGNTYFLGPYLSTCVVDWNSSNTCGVKYVLNTLLALKYQSISTRFSKTQPIVKDNILFKASYDYPTNRGHLEMIKVPTTTQASAFTLWDAAKNVPIAGIKPFSNAPLSAADDPTKTPRYIFTNKPGTAEPILFDTDNVATLKTYMGIPDDTITAKITDKNSTALMTINTIRGRVNASAALPEGDGEASKRLWSIENSTPALKTRSKYIESTAVDSIVAGKDRRDRFLFAGATDGMLHAFWAGQYCDVTDNSCQTATPKQEYPDTDKGRGKLDTDTDRTYAGGKEIWAYMPSSLLQVYDASKGFTVKLPPTSDSDFESGVVVDGSSALGDFLVCKEKSLLNACTKWVWETSLVNTAAIRSTSRNVKLGTNHGIVFALNVTNPYNPILNWEYKYDGLDYKGDATGDTTCAGNKRNCNMGESKGVSIGTAQIGNELKDYIFLTSNWIDKKLYDKNTNKACTTASTDCVSVYGVSAYALNLESGDVMWETKIPYNSDAGSLIDPPAVPSLMDRDNNGSYDYVVFGDMQGRIWALRTTDGVNLTGDTPVHQVKVLDSNGKDTTTVAGYKEPIGAAVAVYRDYVIFGTGGSNIASNGEKDSQKYRIEVIKIGVDGAKKQDYHTIVLDGYDEVNGIGSEQIWAKPAIMSDLKAYVGTTKNYSSSATVSTVKSTGRIIIIDLKLVPDAQGNINNTTKVDLSTLTTGTSGEAPQGVVGGIDVDNQHVYIGTLSGSVIQLGGNNFAKSANKANPYKILWWRKM